MRIIGSATESTYLNILHHDAMLSSGLGEHEYNEIPQKGLKRF